jgi:hypothetical protein
MAVATSEDIASATKAEGPAPGRDERPGRQPGIRGMAVLALALAPAMAALWSVTWFVTQDSPAHVYNAEILSRSFDADSPFARTFSIRWQPIPNWVGHILLAGLVRATPAWAADRIMTSVTLVGFAAAVFWLRLRISGSGPERRVGTGHVSSALLAALLGMNMTWLFGFTSFMLGACLFPITLGFWWPRRDRLGAAGVAGLGILLVLGYFCHLVSLGLTALGLAILALASPLPPATPIDAIQGVAWRRLRTRLVPLGVAFLPLVPLGLVYLGLAHRGGPMHPVWENLPDPWSLAGWKSQLTWADPITLSRKDGLPFTDRVGPWFIAFAPAFWLVAALMIWGAARAVDRLRGRPAEESARGRRGWWILAAFLILGGLASPDTLGPEHGNYLPQRIVLCGLVALAVVMEVDLTRWPGRLAAAGLAAAVALQSAIVWDYALYSDRTAGEIVRARDAVGRGRRVAYLPASIRSRFRANPLLHVDNWLGVDTDNIVWGNYETRHYYFPVQFRAGIDRPSPDELEDIIRQDAPVDAPARADAWRDLLAREAGAIDVLVTFKGEPGLDAVTGRIFREVVRRGEVRVLERDRDRSFGYPVSRDRQGAGVPPMPGGPLAHARGSGKG